MTETTKRDAFETWMVNEAKCIVGSGDPYAAGIERDYWRVWQAALSAAKSGVPDIRDAYMGAREDLAIWKRRALEAEAKLREADSITALATAPEQAGEPVAWRIEHRPSRYTFTEHEENLKLDAGANIVPLYRAFHSVDAVLDSTLDRLESMVTWEPRLLAGPDAIDRLEHINRLLYELLNPHITAPPPASTKRLIDEQPVAWAVVNIEGGAKYVTNDEEEADRWRKTYEDVRPLGYLPTTGICFFCGEPMNGMHEADCPQATHEPLTDEQILAIARKAAPPFPWDIGSTRAIFLDAVRAIIAATEGK